MTVEPAEIDDSVPTEEEIAAAVKKLRRNRSGGAPRIRAEHLKGWLTAAKKGGVAEEKEKKKTEAEEEGEVRRPLELRWSGSRRNELRCTAKYHPRGKTSR